jgi:hypothetical protein
MDAATIKDLAVRYRSELLQLPDLQPRHIDINRTFGECTSFELRCHALYLCEGLIQIASDSEKYGKANRHLTAIQMILSFLKMYSLSELIDHNRPA